MAHIPQSVLDQSPTISSLKLRHRGKVRDSYNLEDNPRGMLVVASNRISIFDFVLPAQVPQKGEILNAMNHFWVTKIIEPTFETDLVACGSEIDAFLPSQLTGNVELQKSASIVRILPSPDVEDIVRFILTGSGLASYEFNNTICGQKIPRGLSNGSMLPFPVYTPTTKATEGHDEHITADSVSERYGHKRERFAIQVASMLHTYASKQGILMADTKFEFSQSDGRLILADEKGTPDSSRFVDLKEWSQTPKGKFPSSLDKQFVREWGKTAGITGELNPQNPEHLALVDGISVPENVLKMTQRIYRYIFWRLTGLKLEAYQQRELGITLPPVPKPNIHVVVGSNTDLAQTDQGLSLFQGLANVTVSVVSCHRNPNELREYAMDDLISADIVIAGAGMAAALPGIVKSELCMLGKSDIPVIGVAFEGANRSDNIAATLSIERLPNQPVELDIDGKAYFGREGFSNACRAALFNEFLPKNIKAKPAQIAARVI